LRIQGFQTKRPAQQLCTDGQYPDAGLIDVKGTLYGTTREGGASGLGTVFAVK
jgi:hypothetical protein